MMGGVSNVSTISERHIPPETMIKKIVRIAKDKDLTREEDCVKIVSEVMERGYIRFKLYTIETKELEMIAAEIGIGGNWIVNKIT
jgi:hypothetical protein